MTELEHRLREACQEAAETVWPGAIRGLEIDAGGRRAEAQRALRPRRPGRVLWPLAAAASVAVIAVGALVVVPRLAGGAQGHAGRGRHVPTPAAGGLAALPRYTVLNDGNGLEVVATATGRVAGRLRAPSDRSFATIAGTAGDRTFFVAAELSTQTTCQTFFYQFSLSADGAPSALTALPVRQLPGLPTALAASASGGLVGYSVVGCATGPTGHIGGGQPIGHIGLIDLAAGRITRRWSYTLYEDYTNDLSMSAGGGLLGYSNDLNGRYAVGRVLAAGAPSGPDQRYGRIVVRKPLSTALSASGLLMYAMTGEHERALAAYDTASGQQVKVLHLWPAATQAGPLVADPAGRYALLSFTSAPAYRSLTQHYPKERRCIERPAQMRKVVTCKPISPPHTLFFSINLATGAVTKLPFGESGPARWGMAAW